VVLAAGGVAVLVLVGAGALLCMLAYGLMLPRVELDVTRDGWLVRRRGVRERWRVGADDVHSVDYQRGLVVIRTSSRARKLRGWGDDMASLAASLRWALSVVTVVTTSAPAAEDPAVAETPVAAET
jgi:hypothetical protein